MDTRVVFDTSIVVRDQSDDGLPPGEEIAVVVRGALLDVGYLVDEPDANAAMWFFCVRLGEGASSLELASNREWAPAAWPAWSLLLGKPPSSGLWARLTGKSHASEQHEALRKLVLDLQRVLAADARFRRVGWLGAEDWRPESTATPRNEPRLT